MNIYILFCFVFGIKSVELTHPLLFHSSINFIYMHLPEKRKGTFTELLYTNDYPS